MSNLIDMESTQEMMDLLGELGYSPGYYYTNEVDFKKPQEFLRSIDTPAQWLVLHREWTDKEVFLEYFENRGWQPKRKMFSPYGPRLGSNEADSLGNPISTVWQIREPSSRKAGLGDIVNVELLADLGKGINNKIYIQGGYMAFFPDGYSNMVLLEFYDEPVIGDNKSMHGKVHYGEKAFKRWKEMRTYFPEVGNPDSINRWQI